MLPDCPHGPGEEDDWSDPVTDALWGAARVLRRMDMRVYVGAEESAQFRQEVTSSELQGCCLMDLMPLIAKDGADTVKVTVHAHC
eukprot:958209-Rhodomonas_salina.1